MPQYELQETSATPVVTDQSFIASSRATMDQHFSMMKDFDVDDIVGAMRSLAAMSGWASEVRSKIQRTENRRLQSFRTKELDPFLEEVDRQFRIWSRIQSARTTEWEMSKGF